MTINQRIKQARKYLGMSQAKFAKNLCLSSGYFAGIELENRRANERIVKLISMTYGISEEWLQTGEGGMLNDSSDPGTEQALKVFRELRPEYQEHVLTLVENLLHIQNAKE